MRRRWGERERGDRRGEKRCFRRRLSQPITRTLRVRPAAHRDVATSAKSLKVFFFVRYFPSSSYLRCMGEPWVLSMGEPWVSSMGEPWVLSMGVYVGCFLIATCPQSTNQTQSLVNVKKSVYKLE